MAEKTRVLLADDHAMLRESLRAWIETQEDFEVVAEASDGREAVSLARRHQPDVAVIDLSMPELNGIEATRQMLKETPSIRVIALSMHSDHRSVGRMLQAGASGYLLKDAAVEELGEAIRTVREERIFLSSGITGVVVEDYVRQLEDKEFAAAPQLTDREREVLQLIAEGKNTKQVALDLHVSPKTIETHRQHIMKKLDLHSLAELTKYAIREGLTSLE